MKKSTIDHQQTLFFATFIVMVSIERVSRGLKLRIGSGMAVSKCNGSRAALPVPTISDSHIHRVSHIDSSVFEHRGI